MRTSYLSKKSPPFFSKLEGEEVTECYKVSRRRESEHYFNEDGRYYVTTENILTKMIPKEVYDKNLKHPNGKVIKKYRYKLPLARTQSAVLDVYKGDLEGLNIIRIKAYKKDNFRKLSWFGEDITDDPTYSIYWLTHHNVKVNNSEMEK